MRRATRLSRDHREPPNEADRAAYVPRPVGAGHARPGRQRGQAMVEAALVALVLIVTLIGIFDMAQVFFIHQTLVERVRSAGRYSAVHAYDPAALTNIVLYNQPTVPEGRTSGVFGITPSMVDIARHDEGTSDDRVTVTLRDYPFRLFTPIVGRAFTGRPIVVSFPYEAP